MNQILVSEKLYVTKEMKAKKRLFKIEFFLSIFLVVALFSYYAYGEYDRAKSEQVSKEILQGIEFIEQKPREKVDPNSQLPDDSTIKIKDNAIVVILNVEPEDSIANPINVEDIFNPEPQDIAPQVYIAKDGMEYQNIAIINIPKIGVNYPIFSTWTDELLKISPCKFWGADPNRIGNFCIVGHNYRNDKFFSKVPTLEKGDIIEITDMSGRTIEYMVYDKYQTDPSDVACTSQHTNGRKEITLITCTNDNKKRVIVKAVEY